MWAKILRIFLLFYLPILLVSFLYCKIDRDHQFQNLRDVEKRAASYRKYAFNNLFQKLVHNIDYWSEIDYPENFEPYGKDSLFMNSFYDIMGGVSDYDQFRLIDLNGKEILRYERDSVTHRLREGELQDKSHRNYFKETKDLKKGEIYLSKLNLNQEYGEIEKRLAPVIRGIAPFYNDEANQLGLVVINFEVSTLLDQLEKKITASNLYLVDNDLNIITSNTTDQRLAYELVTDKNDPTVRLVIDDFKQFKDTSFVNSEGLWSFSKINLNTEYGSANSNYISTKEIITSANWAIIHQIPNSVLNEKLWPIYRNFLIINLLAIITILLSSSFLIRKRLQRQEFYKALEIKNKELKESQRILEKNNATIIKINNRLETRNQQLKEFNYLVSHNLRAPITSMSMVVDLIEESDDFNELKILIPKLSDITKSITQISEDIREYVTILNNNNKILIERLEIRPIIETVSSEFSDLVLKKIDFKIEIKLEAWQEIEFSKFYFKSIIQNLMSNALKYRRKDAESFLVFEAAWENEQKILYIKDNGRGIDMARYGNDIFKLHKRFHRDVQGRGMGLFLVKSQLESLDASITVESEVNKGSVFKIKFQKDEDQF